MRSINRGGITNGAKSGIVSGIVSGVAKPKTDTPKQSVTIMSGVAKKLEKIDKGELMEQNQDALEVRNLGNLILFKDF